MAETISLHAPELTGIGSLTAYLYTRSIGALLNTGGDSLTESPASSGRFTFTLAESRTGLGLLRCDVRSGSVTYRYGWLAEDDTIVMDVEHLDTDLAAIEAQLDLIQTQTDLIGSASAITSLLAAAVLEPGTITSFPETLTIGDSYTEVNGREIQIPIVDTDGVPISSTGLLNFADAAITFTISRSGETDTSRIINGTATFVDPPGTGTGAGAPYAVVELPASETSKGLIKYKYSGVLTFTWYGAGTGTDVMSFETNEITFDN